MRVIEADSYFEKGYAKHLLPHVRLEDPETGEPVPYPNTTCLIAAEKQKDR